MAGARSRSPTRASSPASSISRKAAGKRLVGDKTPAYVRSIPTLHDLWPEAKFVHIVRDGRDVALSAVNWDRAYKLANRYSTWTEAPDNDGRRLVGVARALGP